MAKVRLEVASQVQRRRAAAAVLNDAAMRQGAVGEYISAPSPHGSTFWRRILSCPREHFLANIVHLGSTEGINDNLDTGFIFHAALEAYYRALSYVQRKMSLDRAPDWYAFEEVKPFAFEKGYEETYETVARMLEGYFTKYTKRDENEWEILAVEETLAVDPLEYGFPHSARFDLIFIDHTVSTKALRCCDHKTSRSDDDNVISSYQLDEQILGQVWLIEQEVKLEVYPPFLGNIVNLVTKHVGGARCHRIPVQPHPQQLINWEHSHRAMWKMQMLWEDMDYPHNFAQCSRKFGKCPFFAFCASNPEYTTEDIWALWERAQRKVG